MGLAVSHIEALIWDGFDDTDIAQPEPPNVTLPLGWVQPLFRFTETSNSRATEVNPDTFTLEFLATGTQDDYFVTGLANAILPAIISQLRSDIYRRGFSVTPDGYNRFIVSSQYSERGIGSPLESPGDVTYRFESSAGTLKIKTGLKHISSWDKDGQVVGNAHKGSIDIDDEGNVEGADIVWPTMRISYEVRYPSGVVTEPFAKLMSDYTGHVNSDVFHGYKPGELLFSGATGSDGTGREASVTYTFIAVSNEVDKTIGSITGISKEGHHVAWVEFEDSEEDGESASTTPLYVHIERVYDYLNFTSALGF